MNAVAIPTEDMLDRLLDFLNHVLPTLERKRPKPREIEGTAEADTPLFETGYIDSLSILSVIAFVERDTGEEIPSQMIVMKYFKTPRHIVDSFGNSNNTQQKS